MQGAPRDEVPGKPGEGETSDRQNPPVSKQTTRAAQGTTGEDERIGPYRILERIGAGGMGEVYRAEQTDPIRRTVALKIIKRGLDSVEVVRRFEAERQALALMDHPCIAKVLDAGSTSRGRPYFVMEFVRGIPITAYCDEHKLSTPERLELFIKLCDGVQHAHQKAIIHRDLKPSNVLVTIQNDQPVPKIIDFGVAKATAQRLTAKTMYTALGEMLGTPEYMSPEQAAMTGEDVDTRTDVYSLGVILYELLTGTLPFEPTELRKGGFEGILRMIREKDPARPSTKVGTLGQRATEVAQARRTVPGKLKSRLRGDLDWITMRALEKDRMRRYGSPSDFSADVNRHLLHEAVLAGPPSAAYRARKFVRRHALGVGAGLAAITVLLAFAVTMSMQARRIARERDRADQEALTSDRVSEFLVSVFNVSDPGETRGNSITAREILDSGALRIQRELTDQPPLRAKMMDAMGRVYRNLGLLTQAESLLVGALEIRRFHFGDEHIETVRSLGQLGYLYNLSGKRKEARETLEQALTASQRVLGDDHVETARILYFLGTHLTTTGEQLEGRLHLERALPTLEDQLGENHQLITWCLNDIGISYARLGDLDSALPYFERALKIKVRSLGENHPDVGRGFGNIGYTLLLMGRLDEARSSFEQAQTILARTLEPDHPWIGDGLHNLGELLRLQGEYPAARDTLRRALAVSLANRKPDHFNNTEILQSLALAAQAVGDLAEADSLFKRTLEIRERILPSSHPDLLETCASYATLLRGMERHEDAARVEESCNMPRTQP